MFKEHKCEGLLLEGNSYLKLTLVKKSQEIVSIDNGHRTFTSLNFGKSNSAKIKGPKKSVRKAMKARV